MPHGRIEEALFLARAGTAAALRSIRAFLRSFREGLRAVFSPRMPDYTLRIEPTQERGTWEGWGTSIAWWGVAVGDLPCFSDALFTLNGSVLLEEASDANTAVSVPGLGFNIIRYNVGGCGRPVDGQEVNTFEAKHTCGGEWFKAVEGYWRHWLHNHPDSGAYDWTRDGRQRRAVEMAVERGLITHIELFHNAPPWWMTHEKTAFGGSLQPWNRKDFASYAATVAERLKVTAGWSLVKSIEILNEPSAGWWRPGHGQEGANVDLPVQQEVLDALAAEISSRPGLKGQVRVAGCDENNVPAALRTHQQLRPGTVGQVNVHGYDGGVGPNRDTDGRRTLREAVSRHTPLWMSEYGDGDEGGMCLAQSITQDLTYLQPTAWLYWQVLEALWTRGQTNGWGLVHTWFGHHTDDARRGTMTKVNGKYYVMAQFSRFIRPGMTIIGCYDHNTVCAFDQSKQTLVCVTLNWGNAQNITVDLSRFRNRAGTGSLTFTNTCGPNKLVASRFSFQGQQYTYHADANSVYSLVFDGVSL